jgi:hypothetical protein
VEEDKGLKPAQANSSSDHISKIPNRKQRASGVVQVVDCLSSNPNTATQKKIIMKVAIIKVCHRNRSKIS